MSLDSRYASARSVPTDINEHIDVLYRYSAKCASVLELGVRGCVSSWAFLKGLRDSGHVSTSLVANDLDDHPNILEVASAAADAGVGYTFIRGNDLEIETEPVDLTFIDTWHVYGQLRRELAKFAPLTKKYIIMHDTQVDGERGESLRSDWDTEAQAAETGIPECEIRMGLKPAISEFLDAHPEWRVEEVLENNNGLTVLARHR